MPQNENILVSKRIVITGACSGLGLALSKAFTASGHRVAMLDLKANSEAIAEVTAKGNSPLFIEMDVSDSGAWSKLRDLICEAWGGLDILINNAGIGDAGTIFTINESRWKRILEINIMGVVLGTAAMAPLMRDQKKGHVVNIASMAGLFAMPTMMAYNVSKAGVVSFSETLASELHPHGIQVSCVCPHFFKTNIGNSMADHASPKTVAFLKRQMDHAKVSADEVAQTVIDGIKRKDFLIFTHPGTRRQWLFKRLFPGRVLSQAKAAAAKILK